MKANRPLDSAMATRIAKDRMRSVTKFADDLRNDPRKEERVRQSMCRACFYGPPRIGGAAMTTYACGICGKEGMHSNTNVDALCGECAKEHSLCTHCGGHVDVSLD